ncbi:MAG: sugar transferase [Thermodesulfovibrionia bacterium]|nr:sugar transferase [Thermodesulfovibrionia bacterium]
MTTDYPVLNRLGKIFLDNLLTISSFFVAISLRNASLNLYEFGSAVEWDQHLLILIIIVIVWRGLSGYQEAYTGQRSTSYQYVGQRFTTLKTDILIVLRTVLIGSPIVLSIAFLIKSDFPRTLMLFFGVVNFVMLAVENVILFQVVKYLRKKGRNIRNILILGTGEVAREFIDSVKMHVDWGVKIIGLISREQINVGKQFFGYETVGYAGNLSEALHSYHIDEIVVALPAKHLGDIEEVMAVCDKEGVPFSIISPFFKNLISKSRTELIHGIPIIKFLPVERNDLEMAIKRIADIAVSFVGLTVLAPLFAFIAVLVKLDSSGPIFYKWKILGLNKRPMTSYKFRTMLKNADILKEDLIRFNEMSGAVFKMKDDPRVTRVGKWLRKYSLDELPQLWSVFKGDLSLVGPRPPLQSEVEKFEGWHRRKLSVKPGITCLWQISGRNAIKDFDEWMKLDLKYIDEWSLWLDIKILFKTIYVVFRGTGV